MPRSARNLWDNCSSFLTGSKPFLLLNQSTQQTIQWLLGSSLCQCRYPIANTCCTKTKPSFSFIFANEEQKLSPPMDNIWAMTVRGDKRENYHKCFMLYCVQQYCAQWYTHIHTHTTAVLSECGTHIHIRYMLSPVHLSSVCNVHAPYSAGWNFRQCFFAIWYLVICWHPRKMLRRSSQGTPPLGVETQEG